MTDLTFAEMNLQEQQLTGEWFGTTMAELERARVSLQTAADRATEDEKVNWLRQLGRVVGRISLLQAALESMDAGTMVMAAPDDTLIAQTVDAAEKLGDAIAAAGTASAVVAFVDDLFKAIDTVLA
jgi:hypothetical protein